MFVNSIFSSIQVAESNVQTGVPILLVFGHTVVNRYNEVLVESNPEAAAKTHMHAFIIEFR